MSKAPEKIEQLVETFDRNLKVYRSGKYNETQVRREFIDPLFECLGWDMQNRAGYAEPYKDVIHEDAIKVGGATRAPDYCFRIGGRRMFFLEAKRPAVDIKGDISPAYQLKRYAWSAKLPVSILTDFEEFAVYQCRTRPKPNDKVGHGRIMYLRFTEYLDQWADLAAIFSRDAVLKGQFDSFVSDTTKKRSTSEVDTEFLKEIEKWRAEIARNLALRNPGIGVRELNFAVQRTIDRILFLRMCEDRGIEPYAKLHGLIAGPGIYPRLIQVFERADERYNSGLFHFHNEKDQTSSPDNLTPSLKLDDKILKPILNSLYYPACPYEFSVLPPEILGNVYEQFLGKVIRLTKGHQARIEEKPEVKKAGGVYYTPQYIVEYIVKNTVGKLVWGYAADPDGTCAACGGRNERGGRGSEVGGWGTDNGTDKGKDTAHEQDQEPSGSGGVAEGNGAGGRGLSTDAEDARGGAVRPDQPDTAGGHLCACEHCGRTWQGGHGRLPAIPVSQPGIAGGSEDVARTVRTAQVSQPGRDSERVDSGRDNRQTHQRPHPLPSPPKKEPSPFPTPNPQSLTPKEASALRILDPACGSGSFLLGAYQYLIDWHRDYYVENLLPARDPQGRLSTEALRKHVPPPAPRRKPQNPIYETRGGQWLLTTAEKKRILLNNIYGVDIDAQAVEVTKLSLLLKVLENENQETLQQQLRIFHERALPDLGSNIKCGNSLIGPDFYENKQSTLFDTEEQFRINAFDWHTEFPEVFKGGKTTKDTKNTKGEAGFDAVIGNPPYGAALSKPEVDYLADRFPCFAGLKDIYVAFIENAQRVLTHGGELGYIIPSAWIGGPRYRPLREYLLAGTIYTVVLLCHWAGKTDHVGAGDNRPL